MPSDARPLLCLVSLPTLYTAYLDVAIEQMTFTLEVPIQRPARRSNLTTVMSIRAPELELR